MRLFRRTVLTLSGLLFTCAIVCAGQASDGVHGHVFRNNAIGLTYAFPETYSAKVEGELPMHDPSGREHLILALWTTPEQTGPPQMAFLHDSKPRAADLSRAEIANRYLVAIRQLWVGVHGVKMFGPQKIVFPSCDVWRLDLFQPDSLPHYNAAVVIPLADRSLLAVQINAPSQKEVDEGVDSLRELRLDRKQP